MLLWKLIDQCRPFLGQQNLLDNMENLLPNSLKDTYLKIYRQKLWFQKKLFIYVFKLFYCVDIKKNLKIILIYFQPCLFLCFKSIFEKI
jgi:hypothetical protein